MGAIELMCCEIKVIQAKNIEFKSNGTFFVRYYVSSANNKRIQINTRQIMSSISNLYWNESTSLECLATNDNINNLKADTISLELRWRPNATNLIFRRSSKLVGSAEIPWRMVFGSPKMEMERWVTVVSNKKMNRTSVIDEGVKPPSVQICMRVRVPNLMVDMKRMNRLCQEQHCRLCQEQHCPCQDFDIFALVGSFEAAL